MVDSKTLMNIFGVVAVGALVAGYMNNTQEDFIQNITYTTFREAAPIKDSQFIMSAGQYQSTVPPRAVGNGLGKAVYNNLPDNAYMGVDPTQAIISRGCSVVGGNQFASMIDTKENFDPSNAVPSTQAVFNPQGDAYANALPVGTMDTMTPDGKVEEVVVYDRFMMTSGGSATLRGGTNYIAGDLAIAPLTNSVFGNPMNAIPSVDLNQGALFALGGVNNQTAKDLYSLTSQYKGGTQFTFAGASVADQKIFSQAAAASGISTQATVTAFP